METNTTPNTTQGQQGMGQYTGQEIPLEQAEAEQIAAQREMQKASVWRSIEDGKTAQLTFTGRVYKREAEYESGKSLKYDFELAESNPEGRHKLFSVGSTSRVARDILRNIKAGRLTMFLSRDGIGKATVYKVSTPE